ncbi:MAG: cytidylate kinase family protein [Thermodesulfobacteriota bacterium]
MAIVTISRQVGSFGEQIAKQVTTELGLNLVGYQDMHRLQTECDAEFKKACQAFEAEASGGFLERLFFREPANTAMFAALVYELAAGGDLVILGRGAQIVLGGQPAVLRARVVAPTKLRVRRVQERFGTSGEEAAEFISRVDKQRRSLIESVFHKDLADWSLYDLVINTAELSPQVASALICAAAKGLGQISPQQKERFASLALAKKVEAAIKKKLPTTPYRDLVVDSSQKGQMLLTGVVLDKAAKQTAEKIARGFAGVASVDNQLKTTELSF